MGQSGGSADLTRVTGGHPLLLAEALKSPSVQDAKIPGSVHLKYVSAQLNLLQPRQRRILEWLAVAGTPITTRTISALTSVDHTEINDDISQLSGFIPQYRAAWHLRTT
jgi:hypothetical protein